MGIMLELVNVSIGKEVQEKLKTITAAKSKPNFVSYKEDIKVLRKKLKSYSDYENIIIIGNGGSITSFKAFYGALRGYANNKKFFIVSTMEPDFLTEVMKQCPKNKTLVLVISKSGNTVGVIESLLAFKGYEWLAVTSDNGTLREIAERTGKECIRHPEIGGRYSGITSSAYVPAVLAGIPVEEINRGAHMIYNRCSPNVPVQKNPALKLSAALYSLEQKGFTELFVPIYSTRLVAFMPLITQLVHESFGKHGKGLTVFGGLAPETHHHTNQRFFGGRKNVIGIFISAGKQDKDMRVKVAKNLSDIPLRDGRLGELDGISFAKALELELRGVEHHSKAQRIPFVRLTVNRITPFSVGEFMAFWHYVAVYSAWLRGVDPFDQPQVELAKKVSFGLSRKP
jgi:glucose-6-phosphate isomerase